jgi:hypothetical protein
MHFQPPARDRGEAEAAKMNPAKMNPAEIS